MSRKVRRFWKPWSGALRWIAPAVVVLSFGVASFPSTAVAQALPDLVATDHSATVDAAAGTITITYTAILTVADDQGQTGRASVAIAVTAPNLPPVVAPKATPSSGPAPLDVRFLAGASDPEGQALTYLWDFGDGWTSTEANPLQTYVSPGTYLVKLTVSDPVNLPVSAVLTVSVGSSLEIQVCKAKVDLGKPGKAKGKISVKAKLAFAGGAPLPTDLVRVVFDGIVLLDGINHANGIDVVVSFGAATGTDHIDMRVSKRGRRGHLSSPPPEARQHRSFGPPRCQRRGTESGRPTPSRGPSTASRRAR